MSLLPRITSRAWIFLLLGTCGFLFWINGVRVARVEYISGLVAPELVADHKSPTGYAGGLRRLIVPEHNNDSYQWLAQTQQMLASNEWRVRHVTYDNAPAGREVLSPSPYRWWLGVVAWFDRLVSTHSTGISVERAALFADPMLHFALLIGAVVVIARQFGALPASLAALALTALFPLGGTFLPGQPGDSALVQLCALGSILPLLVGIAGHRKNWFVAAGVIGGVGLWVSVAREAPVLGGIVVGGIIAMLMARRASGASFDLRGAWRAWSLAGAVTSFAAYLIEYFPDRLAGLRLEQVHPLYSLAWLGAGELLARVDELRNHERPARAYRAIAVAVVAVLAIAAVPTLLLTKGADAFVADKVAATRLTNLPGGAIAPDFWTWITRDGFSLSVAATVLPALLLVPAIWVLMSRKTDATRRALVALALGPVLVALALAFFELRWWNVFDSVLLALLTAVTVAWHPQFKSILGRAGYSLAVVAGLVPGLVMFVNAVAPSTRETVTEGDVVALLERDMAYWLANRGAGGSLVVLAPPSLTTSFYFHGGLTGLGTPYWENKEGFMAAIRIAGATSPDEAQAVAQGRQLNYIVIPSWDNFLDEYARMGSNQPDHSLAALLHRWLPPRWLRPVAYHLPKVAGFESQSVAVFQVVEVQDNATALSHLAEYFVEMEQIGEAVALNRTLARLFPGDLSVAATRAAVQHASGDAAGFAATISEIETLISQGEAEMLPWDRRVSLAIVLVEGKRYDAAKEQAKRCLAEIDETKLRSLTTVSLYRLQVMSKAFGLHLTDPALRTLALNLLPVEMRDGL